ncbi:MAG: DUF1579 domain-containing protein [Acidobacteriia bacterium]|nr:DUF1579 domain-containing protein [Terriglobia bacterium]
MKTLQLSCVAALILAASAVAQMPMPKPGPEHKKLDVFAGSWTLEGDMKPGPMGPGGKVTENETCEWMEGGFFLACHVKFSSAAMGNGSGQSFLGYSENDKAYTYRAFNSWGEFEEAKGSWDNDTLTWLSDDNMGGMKMKGRFTMKVNSPTSYNFSYEVSQDGTKWTTAMDGKATKNK